MSEGKKESFKEKYLNYHFLFRSIGSLMVMNSIGVLGLGVFMLFRTWFDIFRIGIGTNLHTGAYIFKSIDIILVGLVLFIFGTSLKSLIKIKKFDTKKDSVFDIFDIETFLAQKHFLWQSFATTLLFVFITQVFKTDDLKWEHLIIPISLALIAISMYFMKKSH